MSNTQVGNVYQQIIADVVESSRVDFEEGGVDEQVLEELKRGWQLKLSQLNVATFPWDPKPEPQQIANPPMVPSNAGNYQPLGAQQQPPYVPQNSNGAPRIKSEPGMDSPTAQAAQYAPNPVLPPNATTAQQRAAANLHANFGPRAAASINAIQQQQQQPQPGQYRQPPQMPPQGRQPDAQYAYNQFQQQARMQQGQTDASEGTPHVGQPQLTHEQYRAAMAQQAAQAQQQAQAQLAHQQGQQRIGGPNGTTSVGEAAHQQAQNRIGGPNGTTSVNLGSAQTDGAGEEIEESVSVIKRINANGEEVMGRIEIDNLLRDKIAAMSQSMEGGGLMLPLHQATNLQKRQRKIKKSSSAAGQHDGPGSDDEDSKDDVKEELDEDAINSDLDDPDDGLDNEEDDDEGMGHIMLCMYDKVQRVKNKWKCVMKDGVLTVNGKEYVFHKATGEYEW